jgi:hypothetical protein
VVEDGEYKDACVLARSILQKFKAICPANLQEEGQELYRQMQENAVNNKTFAALLA